MPGQVLPDKASLLIFDPKFKLFGGRPRPEFMLIGAAKTGSTSLSSYLALHPQVKPCVPKEPNYWTWQLCDRDRYQRLFVNAQPATSPGAAQQIGGEYSTSYLPHPLAPRRIAARLPGIKILVVLRNPLDRAYSHYIMAKRGGSMGSLPFADIAAREIEEAPSLLAAHRRGFLAPEFRHGIHRCLPGGDPISVHSHTLNGRRYPLIDERCLFTYYATSCVFRSIYYDQLWRWLQLYPREQVKVIDAQSLLSDRRAVMAEIVAFLGLQPYQYTEEELRHTWGGGSNDHNTPGDYQPMGASTRVTLQRFFKPHNERLYELVGRQFDWD
jgi:hypothetical protein